jgi:hypothetical protein
MQESDDCQPNAVLSLRKFPITASHESSRRMFFRSRKKTYKPGPWFASEESDKQRELAEESRGAVAFPIRPISSFRKWIARRLRVLHTHPHSHKTYAVRTPPSRQRRELAEDQKNARV